MMMGANAPTTSMKDAPINTIEAMLPPKTTAEASEPPLVPSMAGQAMPDAPVPRSDFYWVDNDEPHASRRRAMLTKYPQIKRLFGHCKQTKYVVMGLVALQTFCALVLAPTLSWPAYLALAYVVGGTSNHALLMAMHELTHNLGFQRMIPNRLFSIFATMPIGVPSAVSFKRYHIEHHRYQGVEGVDVDLPTELEGRVCNHWLPKLLFVFFQSLFYSLRPAFVNPKTPGKWEALDLVVTLVYNALIVLVGGWWALLYLFLSTFLGMGLHPVAGHFIAEHYIFRPGIETYSYYGLLNAVTFNVGYHVEHHDFPSIPGSRLPLVRAIAPEFYATLPQHHSWVAVLWHYIVDPRLGAFSRVKRRRSESTTAE